jgi:hypothetical protein
LNAKREKQLESTLGDKWADSKREEPTLPEEPEKCRLWDLHFLLFLQFRDREGHLKVPQGHVEDGQKLGYWIYNQRRRKRIGRLCPEHERRLNEVGVIWNARDQRVCHAIGKLDAERVKRLESSPDGVNKWNDKTTAVQETAEEHFDRNFDLLMVFNE